MGDPTRKFESETIALARLKRAAAKKEAGDALNAASGKPRRREVHDKARIKVLLLRLIDHFEQDPSVSGEL